MYSTDFYKPFLKLEVVSSYPQESYWEGFPDGSLGKGSIGSAGDIGDVGLIPQSGRSPGVGSGNPLQYFCLENPLGRGAWQALVHGVAESNMTEPLTLSFTTSVSTFEFYHQVKNHRFCQTEYCFSLFPVRLLETKYLNLETSLMYMLPAFHLLCET